MIFLLRQQTLLRYGPAAAATLVIPALSLAPAYLFRGVESALPPIQGFDKLVHAAMYAALTATYLHALPSSQRRHLRSVLLVALIATAYGAVMELGQKWLTTTRSMDVFDALANLTGALTCALLVYSCGRPWRRNGSNAR